MMLAAPHIQLATRGARVQKSTGEPNETRVSIKSSGSKSEETAEVEARSSVSTSIPSIAVCHVWNEVVIAMFSLGLASSVLHFLLKGLVRVFLMDWR
jgi:hypothetical protein